MSVAEYERGIVTQNLDRVVAAIEAIPCRQDFDWEIKKLRDYRDALFALCPVQPGDTVVVRQGGVPVDESSGWWGFRENLREGSVGLCRYVDWVPWTKREGGRFIAATRFDDEPSNGALFLLDAEWVRKVETA